VLEASGWSDPDDGGRTWLSCSCPGWMPAIVVVPSCRSGPASGRVALALGFLSFVFSDEMRLLGNSRVYSRLGGL
jgi:hypothetical protein